jgi:hypothetical protein
MNVSKPESAIMGPYNGTEHLANVTQDISRLTPSPQCSTHLYKPFTEDDQIRLLLIEPGQDILRCRLVYTRLSNLSHSYESISYAWGHLDMLNEIETPDGPMSVPRNLYDALLQLRDLKTPRYVWADRSCINQGDEKERGHQACLMRLIFKNAARVIIWLGTDTKKKANMAFAVLCGVASGGEVHGRYVGQANFYADEVSSANLPDIPCRDGPPPASFKAFWSAVAELFGQSWFWRVGCIQEVRSNAHRCCLPQKSRSF